MMAQPETIILDARGKSLGRVASEAASILRGKTAPTYERHIMPQHRVVITNASSVRLTGKKLSQRTREQYSGFPGGLKKISYEKTFKKDPREFIRRAVEGMIPRNRLRKEILKHLTIYVSDQN